MKNKRDVLDVHLKIGIDGGGGFLKICLSVQSNELQFECRGKRAKYDEGIAARILELNDYLF